MEGKELLMLEKKVGFLEKQLRYLGGKVGYILHLGANETVSIRDFGALDSTQPGGDTVDNIEKINAAINFVFNKFGGGVVRIPDGVFYICPSAYRFIKIKSNIVIDGSGTLKVKDDCGDYETIFGAENYSAYVENITIKNITIDQNPAGNTTGYINFPDVSPSTYQYAVEFHTYKNIWVENVKFDPCCGVNTVFLPGVKGQFAKVNNCFFNFVRANGTLDYDNTAIYIECLNHQITGNVFYADISQKAIAAIESHDGISVIEGNVSEGYQIFCYVVTENGEPKDRLGSDVTVVGNTAAKAGIGIGLASFSGRKLSNVTIMDNTISIANKDRNEMYPGGISMCESDGDFENINICGNTIEFQKEDKPGEIWGESTYGISLAAKGDIKNINVCNNIINNAPVCGIRLGYYNPNNTSTNVKIERNLINNAGIYRFLPDADKKYRAAIMAEGNLINVDIQNNTIYDDNTVFGGYQSICITEGTMINVVVKNNNISSKQGGYYYNVNPSLDIDEGSPVKTYYSSVFPPASKISLNSGDIIINTGKLIPGTSFTGYRAIGPGTTSKLTGVTGSCTAGSNILKVNDSTNIKPDDYVYLAGSSQYGPVLWVKGNEVMMAKSYSTTISNQPVGFFPPEIKGYGQLQS